MSKSKNKRLCFIINCEREPKEARYIEIDKLSSEKIEEIVSQTQSDEIYIKVNSEINIDDVLLYAKNHKNVTVINYGITYILNKCFMGTKYTLFGNNVSHEAINKFEADDGKRCFFLCDDGKINNSADYIISNSGYKNSSYTKQFLLENAQMVAFSEYEHGTKKEYAFIQKVNKLYVVDPKKEKEISYGGVKVKDIFWNNGFSKKVALKTSAIQGEKDKFPCVTFEGENINVPHIIGDNATLFMYEDINPKHDSSEKYSYEQLSKSSMKQYVFEGTTLFKNIKNKLDSISWIDEKPFNIGSSYVEEDSVLSIIGKEGRETYLSSLIAYTLQHSQEILKGFLECGESDYKVYREADNVDILVRGKQNIIVIENKIDAGINDGEKKQWEQFISQEDKNDTIIEEINKQYANCDEQKKSQLQKYYNLALYYAKLDGFSEDEIKCNIKCYILCPEYKTEFYNEEKKKYMAGEKYEIVSYKKLYEAISDAAIAILKEDKKGIIKDLKRTIKRYTIKQNDYYIEKICGRFAERVRRLQEED